MPFRTVNRRLAQYRAALARGDIVTLCSAVEDRDWIDDLVISADERQTIIVLLNELVELCLQPDPDTVAGMRAVDKARIYWSEPHPYRP